MTLSQDLRYGFRMLARSPGFTSAAVLTLALGIGASVVVFSVANALYFKPLPVRDSSALVEVSKSRHGRFTLTAFSYQDYLGFRDRSRAFLGLAAHYSTAPIGVEVGGVSKEVKGSIVSANYFSLLGIEPRLGRFFLLDEQAEAGLNPIAVISFRLWQDRLAGEQDVVGKTIRVNGQPFVIVGVAPKRFHGVIAGIPNDVWLPLMTGPLNTMKYLCDSSGDHCNFLNMIGRLKPAFTIGQAQAEMAILAGQILSSTPGNETWSALVLPAVGVRTDYKRQTGPVAAAMLATVGGALLITCLNLAGLLLARGSARRREIAIRLSLGSSRWRLTRQLLTESLLLSAGGCAVGLLLAIWANNLLRKLLSGGSFWSELDFQIDPRVLLAAVTVCLMTGVAIGLAPALQAISPPRAGRTLVKHADRFCRLRPFKRSSYCVGAYARHREYAAASRRLLAAAVSRRYSRDPWFKKLESHAPSKKPGFETWTCAGVA